MSSCGGVPSVPRSVADGRCRELKRKFQPRYPSVAYFPDRLIVVVLSAILCYNLEWESHGVAIMGEIKAASGHAFTFRWPFRLDHMSHIRDSMATSFLIALLGFFESSVAAKSLGPSKELPGIQLSANRELVALGTANLVGACFMSMPAFGGYGRSKVNKQTGGKTPMSSVFLSGLAVICIFYVLPYFYYLPVRFFPLQPRTRRLHRALPMTDFGRNPSSPPSLQSSLGP